MRKHLDVFTTGLIKNDQIRVANLENLPLDVTTVDALDANAKTRCAFD
ncbi:MAG: hypothetical protein WD825_10525 [Gemmatimonadaceae bacterium]